MPGRPACDGAPTVMFLELEAWVAWPRDEGGDRLARTRFLAAAGADLAERQRELLEAAEEPRAEAVAAQRMAAWEDLYQRSGGRRTLKDAPPVAKLMKEYRRSAHVARQAGRVLDWVIQLHRDPRTAELASLNLAKEIVLHFLPTRIGSAHPMDRSSTSIDSAWASHRCVAAYASVIGRHRAAAHFAGARRGNQLPMEVSAEEVAGVLQRGAAVAAVAATIVPKRRQEPILPIDGPAAPPFPVARRPDQRLDYPPIPDEVLDFIQTRRKRPIKTGSRVA